MLVPPFPTSTPPTPQRGPSKGAGHGQLTPHAPLEGSGPEVQDAGVWLPSSSVPSRPGQPVPSSSDELVVSLALGVPPRPHVLLSVRCDFARPLGSLVSFHNNPMRLGSEGWG